MQYHSIFRQSQCKPRLVPKSAWFKNFIWPRCTVLAKTTTFSNYFWTKTLHNWSNDILHHFSISGNWPTPSDKMALTYFSCVGNTCLWHLCKIFLQIYKIYIVFVTYLWLTWLWWAESQNRSLSGPGWRLLCLSDIVINGIESNSSIEHGTGKTWAWWEKVTPLTDIMSNGVGGCNHLEKSTV